VIFTEDQEARLITATRTIAREEILPRFRALDPRDIGTKRDADDLVTIADRRSEDRLTEALAAILPGAAIVGEEAAADTPALLDAIPDADVCAIIDPIDGTWNYANGISTFGILLAITARGRTIWGGIYDPLGDDWITARADQGAWFRTAAGARHPVRTGEGPATPGEAFGLISLYLYHGAEREGLARLLPGFRRAGSLRCSAHEYRLMAQGRADFTLNAMLNPWDHAAGVLVLTEAGGTARLLDGTPYAPGLTEGRLLAARSGPLWSALAETFAFLA